MLLRVLELSAAEARLKRVGADDEHHRGRLFDGAVQGVTPALAGPDARLIDPGRLAVRGQRLAQTDGEGDVRVRVGDEQIVGGDRDRVPARRVLAAVGRLLGGAHRRSIR